MVTLLRRLFVKNYKNTEEESVRIAHGKFAAWFGIITNLLLAGVKLTAAIMLASVSSWIFPMALVADSINNFSDMGSSIVTLIGFKMSGKPADKEHPFGHQRIEYIAGLVVSTLVVAVAVTLFKDSLTKVIEGGTTSYDLVTIIILGISVLLKLFQSYVNRGIGKAIGSVALMATSLDSLMDVIATSAILVSAVLSLTVGWDFLDGYMGIAVSAFVCYSGLRSIKETADPLIGQRHEPKFIKEISHMVMSYEGIYGVHDVICHNYGPTNRFVSLHVEVDHKRNMDEVHELIDGIENDVRRKFKCEITIHMDPVVVDDPKIDELKNNLASIIKDMDSEITIHDLRVLVRGGVPSVEFDVVIPYESSVKKEDIEAKLVEKYGSEQYHFKITVDRPF